MKEKVSEIAVRDEVFVFKTSLSTSIEMCYLDEILNLAHGIEEWSLDIDDWEKVLRIRSKSMSAKEVMELLKKSGIPSKDTGIVQTECINVIVAGWVHDITFES